MIPFQPIILENKELITSFTYPSDYRNCDFSFANMCSWRFLYDSEYAVVNNFLLIRFKIEDDRVAYMVPIGTGDLKEAVLLIEQDSLSMGHPLCLLGVTPDAVSRLNEIFPDGFKYIPERDYFDYIYLREDLATLRGKKYQSKRNHINRFRSMYDFRYTSITSDMLPQCLSLEAKWCLTNDCSENESLSNERKSLIYALRHFEELGLLGGALWVNNEIVAFTFGAEINHNTFGVHVEKADTGIEGAYTIINQLFAEHIPEKYTYINREEDLGLPGLRKAKLSYHPVLLLEKNVAVKHPS